MRLLYLQNCQSGERGSEERSFSIVDSCHDEIKQNDAQQIHESGELPPNQIDLPVARFPNPFGDIACHENGQCPVDEEAMSAIIWVKRGTFGVEISTPGFAAFWGITESFFIQTNGHDRGLDHRQKAFVGMQVLPLVPIQANRAEPESSKNDKDEGDVVEEGVFLFSIVHIKY